MRYGSMINFLDNVKFNLMQKTLDATWQRIVTISDNVSNIDTPGYKAKRMEFENILRNKINGVEKPLHSDRLRQKVFPRKFGEENTLDSVNPVIYTDPSTQMRVDGNNVDIDHETLEYARTKIQYDYLIRKMSDEYALVRYAITEGRG
jgi:flagellar basal-body rod protein FlgB